jgi:hypothetical protein
MAASKDNIESSLRPVIVHSWDFDGMLAHELYLNRMKEILALRGQETLTDADFDSLAEAIIEDENYKPFFDNQFGGEKRESEHIVFVGSNRQGKKKDLRNGFKREDKLLSCFSFYEALVRKLSEKYKCNITLDKLLLEDLDPRKTTVRLGQTFDEVKQVYENIPADFYLLTENSVIYEVMSKTLNIDNSLSSDYTDEEKGLLLYTQMHYAKKKYGRGREMEFYFADDLEKILFELNKMFSTNPNLVPVKLSLVHCNPGAENPINFKIIETIDPDNKDSNLDLNPLRTYSDLFKELDANKDVLITLYDSTYESTGEKTYKDLGEMIGRHKLVQKQESLLRSVMNLVSNFNEKAPGAIEIQNLLTNNSLSAEEKLSQLKAVARQHLKSDSSFFGTKLDANTKQIYHLISQIDIKNPTDSKIETLQLMESKRPSPGSSR